MADKASPVQLGAAVICVAGIIWTAVMAVQSANPVPAVVVTLLAAAVLLVTVVRSDRS